MSIKVFFHLQQIVTPFSSYSSRKPYSYSVLVFIPIQSANAPIQPPKYIYPESNHFPPSTVTALTPAIRISLLPSLTQHSSYGPF